MFMMGDPPRDRDHLYAITLVLTNSILSPFVSWTITQDHRSWTSARSTFDFCCAFYCRSVDILFEASMAPRELNLIPRELLSTLRSPTLQKNKTHRFLELKSRPLHMMETWRWSPCLSPVNGQGKHTRPVRENQERKIYLSSLQVLCSFSSSAALFMFCYCSFSSPTFISGIPGEGLYNKQVSLNLKLKWIIEE